MRTNKMLKKIKEQVLNARLTSNNCVFIPRDFRLALGLEKGDEVTLKINGNNLVIRKAEVKGNE